MNKCELTLVQISGDAINGCDVGAGLWSHRNGYEPRHVSYDDSGPHCSPITMQVETKSVNVQLNLITPDGEPAGRLRKVQKSNGGMTRGTLQCFPQCCTDIILQIRSLAHVQPSNFGPGAPRDCWYATRRLLFSTNWEYTKRP